MPQELLDANRGVVNTRAYVAAKQDRFDNRITKTLLDGLCNTAATAVGIRMEAADDFNLAWLMARFPSFPVMLMAYKHHRPFDVVTLLRDIGSTDLRRLLLDCRDNYPDQMIGVAFASEGDGLPDMVCHTLECGAASTGDTWCAVLPQVRHRGADIELPGRLYLQPLKGFINCIKLTGWCFDDH